MFHLLRGRNPAEQLLAIVEGELRQARARLEADEPTAEAVHEARVALKRVRAVLRLFEPSSPARTRKVATRLRAAAHALATMREASACIETLEMLTQRYDAILGPAITRPVRQEFERRQAAARQNSAEDLREARDALDGLPPLPHAGATPGSLRRGVRRAYRRARRTMLALLPDSGNAEFHRWRIRVKAHYYHMRLLETLARETRRRARRLHTLEELLGDGHNLAVLQQLLLSDRASFGPERETALLLGCITREQHRLRREALRVGAQVFLWNGKQFATGLRDWWPTARRDASKENLEN